jgi:DNA repair exonuclease SbcCD ATPase subunit
MFKIKNLTVKNFMSVGNATQGLDFDRSDLTLVLGVNIDLGGDDSGARNGTGKTTIINALSYALYGGALTNIRRDNLINKTNGKNMLVTVDFEYNDISYKIERGRKPNIMKFFVSGQEQEITNESQGDSRQTQAQIERMLGMSSEMFKHIVALNTYTEPFLSLKAKDQRDIIEQLLGITILSEKAEALKEQNKTTKDEIIKEEFRIKALQEANERIERQLENLKRRQTLWITKHNDDIKELNSALNELKKIDITKEIEQHKLLSAYKQKEKDLKDISDAIERTQININRDSERIKRISEDINKLEDHTCSTCGQEFHDKRQVVVTKEKKAKLKIIKKEFKAYEKELVTLNTANKELGELGNKPETFYTDKRDAFEHRASLEKLEEQLGDKKKEEDPYNDQINEMTEQALAEIEYTLMNELVKVREHQDFLLKLLTNKDSFVRKRIIEQNLSYLNARLSQYLDRIGLPHEVTFLNDLTVEIQELGRELDFDNLSRGERNRLILSLSWAFRDVWESLYNPINLLFIDELVDSGMDGSGVEAAMAILKKMSREHNKSIWLVSHKDELSGRVNNVMTVTKENGFTSYNTDVDII